MSLFSACQRHEQAAVESHFETAKSINNLAYGTDSLQIMDVYLPANRSTGSTKALVLIHGGGWTNGSKADFALYIDTFKKRLPDYALFNINYRLVNGTNLFPTQEQDVNAALQFIVGKAEEFSFNKNNLVLMGASAGAHLALLQAYKYVHPEVKAVIDYFGPTDLMAMYQQPWHPLVPMAMQMVTGTTPILNAALYMQSSPVNYVDESSPATLILHGSRDGVVDISQSRKLQQVLEKSNVAHEFAIYPTEGHGWWRQPALSSSFDRIERFLGKHLP